MPRELGGRALHAGVVAACLDHGALELIGDDGPRHAVQERERAGDARDEVRHLLRPGRLRERVVARAEDRDEQLDLGDLAGHRIDDPGVHARVIDEELVARDVHLAHDRRLSLLPCPIPVAERGVPQTVWVRREVLDVQQGERHARTPQLHVQRRAVRLRAHARRRRLGVEPRFELGVAQRLDAGRVQAVRPGVGEHARHGARADAERPGYLPVGAPKGELLPEDFSQLLHRESLCRPCRRRRRPGPETPGERHVTGR